MLEEEKFGKLLFQSGSRTSQVALRRLICLIPFLIVFALGLVLFIDPDIIGEEPGDSGSMPVIIMVASVLYVPVLLLSVKGYHAAIYERGFVVRHGSKVTEAAFTDITGINTSESMIKSIRINLSGGKIINMVGIFVPNLQQFIEEFTSAYTKTKMSEFTPEMLRTKTISFGNLLRLENGNFIADKGKIVVPLGDVYNIEIKDEGIDSYVHLKGAGGEDLIIVPFGYLQDFDLLRRIIHLI